MHPIHTHAYVCWIIMLLVNNSNKKKINELFVWFFYSIVCCIYVLYVCFNCHCHVSTYNVGFFVFKAVVYLLFLFCLLSLCLFVNDLSITFLLLFLSVLKIYKMCIVYIWRPFFFLCLLTQLIHRYVSSFSICNIFFLILEISS